MGLAFDTRHATTDELLERDDALAVLAEALNEARLGFGRIVLVGGEAGAGKTTLVRTFCARLGPRITVLAGACDALSTPRPLGPLFDIATECDALADVLHAAVPPSDVFTVLRDELAEGPTVLVIEDMHWGDEATFDVLRLLCRRMDVPSLVIGTYRDDGLHREHPMRVLLGDLATAPAVDRLALGPLSAAAVGQLALGYDIDADDLYARTGGNPFFVAQVLAAGGTGVPPTVRDAVLARISGLSESALEVLETVALALPRAEPWLLEAVLHDGTRHLDECLASGLVSADTDVAFRHELARVAVEDAMAPTRRLGLQRRILDALTARGADEIDPARLAHHAEAAGDIEAVLEFAVSAATRASLAGAYREAAAQYARALRVGEATLSAGRRAELLEGRSRACYLADDQLEAIDVIRAATASRREEGSPAREASDLAELSSYLYCRGLIEEGDESLEAATRLTAGLEGSSDVAFVDSHRAMSMWFAGDPAGGVELARQARETALQCGDPRTALAALVGRATIELRRDAEAGQALMLEAIAEAESAGITEQHARALNNLGGFGLAAPHHALAETYLPQALEFCTAHNEDLWRINALALAARNALDRGRYGEAAELADRLLQDPRESPWPHHEALVVLALVRARRGDPGAGAALDDAAAVDVPPDEITVHDDRAAARAEVAWLEQRPDAVAEATGTTIPAALDRGDTAAAARLLFWRRLAGLDATPVATGGPLALALAGDWAAAADEWARTCFPYEAALARLETGDEETLRQALEALQELGALPASQLATRRLRALGARGLVRGPRKATRENAAGLTPREIEVLGLLAEGHRNAQIAERLYLSRRTVDTHVSALLRKLDAGSRLEAVAAAQRLDLLQDR